MGGGQLPEYRRALNRPAHHSEDLRPQAGKPGGVCLNEHGGSAPYESHNHRRRFHRAPGWGFWRYMFKSLSCNP